MQNKQMILQNWNNEQVSINDIINNIFNLLNINDIEIKNKVIEISRNSTAKNPSDKWFYALKIVSIYCVKNSMIFYQSQLYDLLTILSRILDEKKKDVGLDRPSRQHMPGGRSAGVAKETPSPETKHRHDHLR